MRGQIQKINGNLVVQIPDVLAEQIGLQETTSIEISIDAGQLVIQPHKTASLHDLLAEITDDNMHHEVDWGAPRGNEVW